MKNINNAPQSKNSSYIQVRRGIIVEFMVFITEIVVP